MPATKSIVCRVAPRQGGAASVPRAFDVDAFVARCRIPVIDPKEGADLENVSGFAAAFDALGRHEDDLSRPQVLPGVETQVGKGAGLHRHDDALVVPADDDRGPSPPVPRRVDAFFRKEKDRARADDGILGDADPLFEALSLVDERGHELGRIELPAAHLGEVQAPAPEGLAGELGSVLDGPDRRDREISEVRPDEKRLVVGIADDADPRMGMHAPDIVVELRAELGVLDVMDDPAQAVVPKDGQAAPLRPQVRMVVRPVIEIGNGVPSRCDPEETAHGSSSGSGMKPYS